MQQEVSSFISELKAMFGRFRELSFSTQPGATADQIAAVEKAAGIVFDDTLKSLWMFSNGSARTDWFGVFTDENTACEFLSVDESLKAWREWNGLGEKWGGQGLPDRNSRDRRIQLDWKEEWFPFAEFNGCATMILFDPVPSPAGKYGQIIAYQHDPDAVYYVAESTAAYLKMSAKILEPCLQELAKIKAEYRR